MNNTMMKICLAACLACCGLSTAASEPVPARILSMAPSTTEILFALGLGDRVVGITRFCDFPPEAQSLPRVGGYMDPNYEQIVRLQPDLAILLDTHKDVDRQLNRFGLHTLLIPFATIADIHASIDMIGNACGAAPAAKKMLSSLQQRQKQVQRATAKRQPEKKPRVLICIGRDHAKGSLAGLYIAGRNSFYDELLEWAGAVNAYTDTRTPYPQISVEGLLHLNPDIILDLIQTVPEHRSLADIRSDWASLASIRAVQQGQVHIITGDDALRPGPRYIRFLEQLADLLEAYAGADADE